MFSKIEVNGENTHPVYRYLRRNSSLYVHCDKGAEVIAWNFGKFLVNGEGKVVSYHGPKDNPLSFQANIEALLWVQWLEVFWPISRLWCLTLIKVFQKVEEPTMTTLPQIYQEKDLSNFSHFLLRKEKLWSRLYSIIENIEMPIWSIYKIFFLLRLFEFIS